MNYVDPRSEITHEFSIGQVYKDSRTKEFLILLYLDRQTALLRGEDGHSRIVSRTQFEREVGGSRYKLQPDHSGFGNSGRMSRVMERAEEYENAGGRKKKHYAEGMREAIAILTDEESADDRESIPFEDIDGVGAKTAQRLREGNYSTVADVRRASNSELLDVSGVGESNLSNIREYVK